MNNLSPSARAALDATFSRWPRDRGWIIAAALRAVAKQVVPEPPAWEIGVLASADREVEIRREILAIAAELEGCK